MDHSIRIIDIAILKMVIKYVLNFEEFNVRINFEEFIVRINFTIGIKQSYSLVAFLRLKEHIVIANIKHFIRSPFIVKVVDNSQVKLLQEAN